jgi:hypothetical protein
MLLNDGSGHPPKLRVFLNLDSLVDLPADSAFPSALLNNAASRDAQLAADGFEGVQVTHDGPLEPGSALPHCGLGRINCPEEADTVIGRRSARGDQCVTLHVGWGVEDDDAIDRLVEAILSASAKHRLPTFIETHRATVTQDMWRTVQIARRFPEVRFNLDLSHYYCGQEMVYGDFEAKLDFLQPLFDRCGFIHGRIAAPGWMQAPIGVDPEAKPAMAHGVDYLAHFRAMWTRAMAGFIRRAETGSILVFAPELLRSEIYYARSFPDSDGQLVEESDRYAQAVLYGPIARECFRTASQQSC